MAGASRSSATGATGSTSTSTSTSGTAGSSAASTTGAAGVRRRPASPPTVTCCPSPGRSPAVGQRRPAARRLRGRPGRAAASPTATRQRSSDAPAWLDDDLLLVAHQHRPGRRGARLRRSPLRPGDPPSSRRPRPRLLDERRRVGTPWSWRTSTSRAARAATVPGRAAGGCTWSAARTCRCPTTMRSSPSATSCPTRWSAYDGTLTFSASSPAVPGDVWQVSNGVAAPA